MDLLEPLARILAGWTLLSVAVGFGWCRFMTSQNDQDDVDGETAAEIPPDVAAFTRPWIKSGAR